MSHCPFHLSFHHSRCDTALSLFASKWLHVSCYAWWLRHVISGILAGGIPGFRMVLLLLRSPPGMALWLCFSSLLFLLPYLVKMIQCYHSCINSPMNWRLSHLCLAVLFWVAAVCFGCLFFFGLFVCFWFLLLFLVFWWRRDRLDSVQVLYQITLEAPQSAGGHVCIN